MHVCPNCGIDLQRFEPMRLGDLEIEPHQVRWKGKRVRLGPGPRMMVSALARAHGTVLSLGALSELMGSEESKDPHGLVRVQLCNARRSFKTIDQNFNAIKTIWGVGVHWCAER